MAYEPVNWKNRVVERPRTYHIQNNPDGTVTLIPAPGQVYEEGTPVDALHLNKMEQGLVTHQAEKATETKPGHVAIDGESIIVNESGIISAHPVIGGVQHKPQIAISTLFQMCEVGYGGDIWAIAVDDNHVYVGGETTQTVKKLNKSNLSQVAESAN